MKKCPICDGSGHITSLPNGTIVKCTWCNGTGEVKQTELEYIQTCTIEQLAEVLSNISADAWFAGLNNMDRPVGQKDNWQQWLKQLHQEE